MTIDEVEAIWAPIAANDDWSLLKAKLADIHQMRQAYGVDYATLIQHLKASGVDAIEAFHRSHSDDERHQLWKLAEQYGLGITVGSDFHSFRGGHRPGHMPVVVKSLPTLISSA